jgi:chemotaxis signal transduction protein
VGELVTFALDGQRYAARVDEVREVVRLAALAILPGLRPPVVGILDLRGASLPVVDVRRAPSVDGTGDVLVVTGGEGDDFGFACDRGTDVATHEKFKTEAKPADGPLTGLPGYVESVLRAEETPIFLVDVRRMAQEYADSLRLDVPLEDRALGETGQALADALGASLPDALDRLEVVDVGGQQLLQAAEVVDDPVDDQAGEPGDLRKKPVAARRTRVVKSVDPAGETDDLRK